MCIIDLQQIALTGNIHDLSNYLSSADKMNDKWRYWEKGVVLMLSSNASGNDARCFDSLVCTSVKAKGLSGRKLDKVQMYPDHFDSSTVVPSKRKAQNYLRLLLFVWFIFYFSKNFRKTKQTPNCKRRKNTTLLARFKNHWQAKVIWKFEISWNLGSAFSSAYEFHGHL